MVPMIRLGPGAKFRHTRTLVTKHFGHVQMLCIKLHVKMSSILKWRMAPPVQSRVKELE